MNTLTPSLRPTAASAATAAPTLSSLCREHLESEESLLTATRDALRTTRAALLGHTPASADAARQQQEAATRSAAALAASRRQLQAVAAAALDLPPEHVTFRKIAELLPADDAAAVRAAADRLRLLADEVDRLNRANASLLLHSLTFLNGLFADLTGTPTEGAPYGPAGRPPVADRRPFLQVRG